MELSVQNSNFLSFLSKLDIDVKQFPEKTFDGLFENLPESSNYFFNWFIENITSDNVLTQSEQATYFQLANSDSLCSEEEVSYVLSTCSPTFEELMSLDVNYVNSFLSEDLSDLKKTFAELCSVSSKIEYSYDEIKKKQNNLKEIMNAKKKYLSSVREDCHETNSSLGKKLEEVKLFLLEEPHLTLDFNLFYDSLPKEGNIYEFHCNQFLPNEISNVSNEELLNMMEEDLHCAEICAILLEGFLKLKRVKIDYLSKLLQNKTSQICFNNHSFVIPSMKEMSHTTVEEIKALESELFDKCKILSHSEVQKISDEYLSNKLELNASYLKELTNYKSFVTSNLRMDSCLLYILLRSMASLENATNIRKQLLTKLTEHNITFSKDVTNFELRKQRFKAVTACHHQHLLSAVRNVMELEENPENSKETLKNILELMSHGNDDSTFITCRLRSDLQALITGLLNTTLCGPTSQLLFVPVELLVKLQDCEQSEGKLSQAIKRVVNKYVDAKATVSKSDRKILLLWIDFLTNQVAFLTTINQPPRHR